MFTFVKIDREIILEKVSNDNLYKKYEFFCKKCLTIPCGSGIVNKLSQGIASEILKNKIVFRKFKLTVDNRLNL